MDSVQNVHKGHRDRMKNRYLSTGIEGFSEHEVLEMLLYYSVPQKDTNELAHELINKFGSLRNVLEASADELVAVNGVKLHTAVLFGLVRDINRKYISTEKSNKRFDRLTLVGDYLTEYFAGLTHERVCVMLFDNSLKLIDCVKISDGSINSSYVDYRLIAQVALFKKASGVILAHNHPGGLPIPSSNDLDVTRAVDTALSAVGVLLIEHIVVGATGYSPIMKVNFGYMRSRTSMGMDSDFIQNFYKN